MSKAVKESSAKCAECVGPNLGRLVTLPIACLPAGCLNHKCTGNECSTDKDLSQIGKTVAGNGDAVW